MESHLNQQVEENRQKRSEQTKKGISATNQVPRGQTEAQCVKMAMKKDKKQAPDNDETISKRRKSSENKSLEEDKDKMPIMVSILKEEIRMIIRENTWEEVQKLQALDKSFQKYLQSVKINQQWYKNEQNDKRIAKDIKQIENSLELLKCKEDNIQKEAEKRKQQEKQIEDLKQIIDKFDSIRQEYQSFYQSFLNQNQLFRLTNVENNSQLSEINKRLNQFFNNFSQINLFEQEFNFEKSCPLQGTNCPIITQISMRVGSLKKKVSSKHGQQEQEQKLLENEVMKVQNQEMANESVCVSFNQSPMGYTSFDRPQSVYDPVGDNLTCFQENLQVSEVEENQNDF